MHDADQSIYLTRIRSRKTAEALRSYAPSMECIEPGLRHTPCQHLAGDIVENDVSAVEEARY